MTMKLILIPLAIVAGHAAACPDGKDAMAPADMSVASKTAPASSLSKAIASKPAPAAVQAQKAAISSNRTAATAPARQTKVASKASVDQTKDKTL